MESIMVSGFLRWQAYGKDWSEQRWVYIEDFKRRQWVLDTSKMYIVNG